MDVSNDTKKEAWSRFKDYQTVMLATAEAGYPRVRPVTLIDYDHKLWVATGMNCAKVKEIRGNPNIEFCLQFQEEAGDGYVRITGLGDVITDRAVKEKLFAHTDFLADHWEGADDPSYALIQIIPVEVEYMRPGDMDAQRFGV
jgi:general stress protein 26